MLQIVHQSPTSFPFFRSAIEPRSTLMGGLCDMFTCALVSCFYCAISASACTSAGPFSLKQNGVFTYVITSGCTDLHTAHSTFIGSGAELLLISLIHDQPLVPIVQQHNTLDFLEAVNRIFLRPSDPSLFDFLLCHGFLSCFFGIILARCCPESC